jgi:hypothetical protein
MIKITKTIPFQRFHKSEFRNLVKELLTVLGSFPSLMVFIKIWFDRLKEADGQLDTLIVPLGKHPDTTELVKTRNKSMDLIKSILSLVKSMQRAKLQTQVNDLLPVETFVLQYLKPIVKADWSDRTFNLDKMFVALSSDSTLQDAVENLNMKPLFDELNTLMDNQKSIRESRSESLRRRRKINTKGVRATVTVALQELFAAIELAQIEHPEVDFAEMVNGINQCLDFYISQAKTRKTLNEKKPDDITGSTAPTTDTKAA